MGLIREERMNLQKKRWAVIATRGPKDDGYSCGILGFGMGLTVLTFLQEWIFDNSISGPGQAFHDPLVRAPICLLAGYFFGLLTWKWFSKRCGSGDGSMRA